MANISEIESQIEQTKLALKSLEAQLAAEKSGGRQTTKGSQRNVGGEDEGAPSSEEAADAMREANEEEMSFSDRVDQRMSEPEESPAEEVSSEEAAPMVKPVLLSTPNVPDVVWLTSFCRYAEAGLPPSSKAFCAEPCNLNVVESVSS